MVKVVYRPGVAAPGMSVPIEVIYVYTYLYLYIDGVIDR